MGKIKIPHQVRITKNIAYQVLYADVIENQSSILGITDDQTKQILLSLKQSPTNIIKTFIHEIIHAIDNENKGPSLTESQVRKLEEGIYRVLRLNHWL